MNGIAIWYTNFWFIRVCLGDLRAARASHFPHSSQQKAGFPLLRKTSALYWCQFFPMQIITSYLFHKYLVTELLLGSVLGAKDIRVNKALSLISQNLQPIRDSAEANRPLQFNVMSVMMGRFHCSGRCTEEGPNLRQWCGGEATWESFLEQVTWE